MICLRKTEEKDIPQLYKNLNKKYVEKNSSDKKDKEEEYCKWYRSSIKSPNFLLFIIEDEKGTFLGHIKYEISDTFVEVMIFIVEEFRNKGIAREALNKSFVYIPNNKKILAKILEENLYSIRVFESLDFEYVKREKEFSIYEKRALI